MSDRLRVFPPTSTPLPASTGRAFANRAVFLPAWFPTVRSGALSRGRVRTVALGSQRVVLWRDGDGVARAFDPRCPHLGADLGFGRVVDGELRCALHHWRFRGDGGCAHATSQEGLVRCARSFPVVEQHGVVFVYPSGASAPPAFPALPDGDSEHDFRKVHLPATHLACHHHLVTANGLDAVHFETLHGLEALAPASFTVDDAASAVHFTLRHRHRHRALRALLGTIEGRFSAHGPSIAWVTATAPVRMHVLFCTRPEPDGTSTSRATLFLPRHDTLLALRSVAFLFTLLWQDGQMLNSLRLLDGERSLAFVESDAPLRAYASLLEKWPRT